MKRSEIAVGTVLAVLLLASIASTALGGVTIELLNPPPGDLLELDVDESYTFDIQIMSDDPFVLAMTTADTYYQAKYVRAVANEKAHHTTSTLLHVTITGKGSTIGLAAVHDWPEPGINWQEGTCPVSIVAGVRYKGGVVVAERFSFTVAIP